MQFFVFTIAALAVATSFSCIAAATAAARKRKFTTKGSVSYVGDNCAIPLGLDHGVCRDVKFQLGASRSSCGVTSDCVVPQGLEYAVCRQGKCQHGLCFD